MPELDATGIEVALWLLTITEVAVVTSVDEATASEEEEEERIEVEAAVVSIDEDVPEEAAS